MIKSSLREIQLIYLDKPKQTAVDLVLGKSLCPSCYKKIFTFEENPSTNDNDLFTDSVELSEKETLNEINSVCYKLHISPATKIIKLNKSQRVSALQKKTKNFRCNKKKTRGIVWWKINWRHSSLYQYQYLSLIHI